MTFSLLKHPVKHFGTALNQTFLFSKFEGFVQLRTNVAHKVRDSEFDKSCVFLFFKQACKAHQDLKAMSEFKVNRATEADPVQLAL